MHVIRHGIRFLDRTAEQISGDKSFAPLKTKAVLARLSAPVCNRLAFVVSLSFVTAILLLCITIKRNKMKTNKTYSYHRLCLGLRDCRTIRRRADTRQSSMRSLATKHDHDADADASTDR